MQTAFTEDNAKKRAEPFQCPICRDVKDRIVVFSPCGHRACGQCAYILFYNWHEGELASERAQRPAGLPLCHLCRASITGVALQENFDDSHRLFSSFCVQLPIAPAASI